MHTEGNIDENFPNVARIIGTYSKNESADKFIYKQALRVVISLVSIAASVKDGDDHANGLKVIDV